MKQYNHWSMIWSVAFVYVGTVIGAGYATGQELYYFFARFGTWGILGSFLSGVLFSLLGAIVLSKVRRHGLLHFGEMLHYFCGQKAARWLEIISFLFLFAVIAIVLAGAGALALEQWKIDYRIGVILAAAAIYVITCFQMRVVLLIQSMLVPMMLILMVALVLVSLWRNPLFAMQPEWTFAQLNGALLSAGLYVAYNFLGASAALTALGQELPVKTAWQSGIIGGIILGLLAAIMTVSLLGQPEDMAKYQVPMAYMARAQSGMWPLLYGITLWVALITTGVSTMFSLVDRVGNKHLAHRRWVGLFILLTAIPLTAGGFARLVQLVYPLAGWVSFILIFSVLRGAGRRNHG